MQALKLCPNCAARNSPEKQICQVCGASLYYQQPRPIGFICPYCHTNAPPIVRSKVSTFGWIVFVLLFLSCFGVFLCWVGLLFREHYKICSNCRIKLG